MIRQNLAQETLQLVNFERDKHKAEVENYEFRLLEHVVMHNWSRHGEPDEFEIPAFQGWGRLVCRLEVCSEEGLRYIRVWKKRYSKPDQHHQLEIDVEDYKMSTTDRLNEGSNWYEEQKEKWRKG